MSAWLAMMAARVATTTMGHSREGGMLSQKAWAAASGLRWGSTRHVCGMVGGVALWGCRWGCACVKAGLAACQAGMGALQQPTHV